MSNLFFTNLFSDNPADRFYFFAVVLVVVASIVLHELAHGWAAIRRGDHTPERLGRMTGNPMVHMGPFSLLALAIAGIAWGQMPIDPTRMRGKYAEAFVSAAGPAMNLIIAVVTLTGLGVLMRLWGLAGLPPVIALFGAFDAAGAAGIDVVGDLSMMQQNALRLLAIAGTINLLLMFFNLLPAPPLDGSHILANFSPRYGNFIYDPANQGAGMLFFIGAFIIASGPLMGLCIRIMENYVGLIAG